MKRILAITLALILILSCCPSVYAAAEESSDNSYSLSDMDPKIKKIIDSKIPQAEKEELIALVPDLSDAQLLLNVIPFGPWHCIEKPPEEIISSCIELAKRETVISEYLVFADSPAHPYVFSVRQTADGLRLENKWYPDRKNAKYIEDIYNLSSQVEINGKLSPITDICIFMDDNVILCILTEEGALFKCYESNSIDSKVHVFNEKEFKKQGSAYAWYRRSISTDEHGNTTIGDRTSFLKFLDNYDQCMARAEERNAKRRAVQTKQAFSTYGPIGLGVVLVAGAAAVGVVIYRKRRKAVLPIEVVADPVDDP